MRGSEIRNSEQELHQFQLRVGIAGAVVLAAFALLAARFLWLQVLQHDVYQAKVAACDAQVETILKRLKKNATPPASKLLPVRRFRCVLDQANFNRPLLHLLREIKLWSKFLRNLRRKRNDGLRTGHNVQAANFAILVVNNLLRAGQKRISGENVARET